MSLTALGEARIGKRRVFVVLAEGPPIGRRWWYFDAASGLLVRTRHRSLTNGQWLVEDLSDFRRVDGIMVPFRVEDYRGGKMVAELAVEKVRMNEAVKEKVFRAPGAGGGGEGDN